MKSIAYYLPQFHEIPENNKWWGAGFTEWTNVKRAIPYFEGHTQPYVPQDYYDLSRDNNTLHKQIAMAKKYGLHGFCFHYYWFSGKRLLEKPIEMMLRDNSPQCNFPFMLCWANENWTRRWDGAEHDVLIKQNHTPEDHMNVVRDLMRYMIDDRYIKIKNKPILVIYRVHNIDMFLYLKLLMNQEAKKAGFDGVYIVATAAFNYNRTWEHHVDAVVDFPPHPPYYKDIFYPLVTKTFTDTEGYPMYRPAQRKQHHVGKIYDYKKTADSYKLYYEELMRTNIKKSVEQYYPCVFPSWDNTARKMENSHIFAEPCVEKFKEWLTAATRFSTANNDEDNSFVFINAWNEWAEGAMLEPNNFTGYKNLQAVKHVTELYN